jgi:ADP-ribose pyrophosphatase YjhB (NUDIX family)
MPWRRNLQPFVRPFYQAYSRLSRGATLGVRGLVVDEEGRILLVEHTYVHGWFLPGGGVEAGETVEHALMRELQEEAGVQVIGRPQLLGVHANHRVFKGDHVVLYRVDAWEPCEPAHHQGEILAREWFEVHALPEGVTDATRRRIDEVFAGHPVSPHW